VTGFGNIKCIIAQVYKYWTGLKDSKYSIRLERG